MLGPLTYPEMARYLVRVKLSIIFLVDDDEFIREAAGIALDFEEDWTLFCYASGEEMFESLDKVTPDLILLDVQMPGMSGKDVLEKLQSDAVWSEVPVFLMTATGESALRELGGLGARAVIGKPFDLLGLPQLIRDKVAQTL